MTLRECRPLPVAAHRVPRWLDQQVQSMLREHRRLVSSRYNQFSSQAESAKGVTNAEHAALIRTMEPSQCSSRPRFKWGSNQQIVFSFAVAVLGLALLVGFVFFVFVPLLLGGSTTFFTGSLREILATALTLAFAIAFVQVVLVRAARVSWRELGWDTSDLRADLGWGLIGHASTQIIFFGVLYWRGESFTQYLDTLRAMNTGRHIQTIMTGVQVAIMEESIYRGYMQKGLMKRLPPLLAITLMAVVFSICHLQFEPIFLAINFAYGMIWGVLRHRTGRLFAPALAHFLNWAVNAGL
jgi:membrane protease YdiL (CAAX protease family)